MLPKLTVSRPAFKRLRRQSLLYAYIHTYTQLKYYNTYYLRAVAVLCSFNGTRSTLIATAEQTEKKMPVKS